MIVHILPSNCSKEQILKMEVLRRHSQAVSFCKPQGHLVSLDWRVLLGALRLLSLETRSYSDEDHVSFISRASMALDLRMPSLVKLELNLAIIFS